MYQSLLWGPDLHVKTWSWLWRRNSEPYPRVNQKVYFIEILLARTKKSRNLNIPVFLCIFIFALRYILFFVCHYLSYVFPSLANKLNRCLERSLVCLLRPDLWYFLRMMKLLLSSALWTTKEISSWLKHLKMYGWLMQGHWRIVKLQVLCIVILLVVPHEKKKTIRWVKALFLVHTSLINHFSVFHLPCS